MNPELTKIGNKLFDKVEFASQKVELGILQDLQALFDKGFNMIKEANAEKQKVKNMYSQALIILDQNIPAQADNAIKKAIDLDATEVADKFKKLKNDAEKLSSEYMKLYNSL